MRFATSLAMAATASAQALKGFNYGATHTDNSPMTQSDFQGLFQNAQNLPGASGFTSARLYTTIQAGTTSDPTQAIPAAIATKTKLFLGFWASSGQTTITNEISAFKAAVSQYGSAFTDLIVGISVGSEDLYRDSVLGVQANAGVGADPDTVANYISQVKSAISGTGVSAPVGHVDTWTAWVNSSVSAVTQASDFIGMDAYPYFQSTMANSISVGKSLFDSAYAQTKAATGGKPVWIAETGWPVSGPQSNQAEANTQNAQQYWEQVGCGELFGQVNTFWYTLQDALPGTPSPSFGVVASGTTPLYDLSCSNITTSALPTGTASATVGSAASATDAGSPGISGAVGSPGSGSVSGSGSGPYSVATYTNSAGVTLVTSLALANGTGAPTVGTPVAPTATNSISTNPSGAAVANAGSVMGVVGAALAVVAAL